MSHLTLHADDLAGAATFAVENLGPALVHVAEDGAHYLRAHGIDPYSLVYTPANGKTGMDHVSYPSNGRYSLA